MARRLRAAQKRRPSAVSKLQSSERATFAVEDGIAGAVLGVVGELAQRARGFGWGVHEVYGVEGTSRGLSGRTKNAGDYNRVALKGGEALAL